MHTLSLLTLLACSGEQVLDQPIPPPEWPMTNLLSSASTEAPAPDVPADSDEEATEPQPAEATEDEDEATEDEADAPEAEADAPEAEEPEPDEATEAVAPESTGD